MRLIPGKTKVKIEIFRGITLGDVIIGVIVLGLLALVAISTLPGRLYIAIAVFTIGVFLLLRFDEQPVYVSVLSLLRYLAYPRNYWRVFSDKHLQTKNEERRPGEHWNEYFDEKIEPEEVLSIDEKIQKIKDKKDRKKAEDKILNSETATDEEKNKVWRAKEEKKKSKKDSKHETKENLKKYKNIEDIIPFTGISDGFIEYNGKYYGTVIEIEPVEFRFFSQHRRDASIEECFGRIVRSVRENYACNIVKIDRPIIYNDYLDKEYDRLDDLRASYESGLLSEEELQARVEIQYDRINEMRSICFDNKVIQPFYYLVLFNIDKKQLQLDTDSALSTLEQGELKVRRLSADRDIAIFLKYSNCIDFDEWDIDNIDPKDYVAWAMPESAVFSMRKVAINKIVTHQMKVVNYPSYVGDSWLAGVMSIPGTKVVVKATPIDRVKAIRLIDRSLQELRGQYNSTSIDSKKLEIENHVTTLGHLLVTLQQENESLLSVNIYISMYDAVKTAESGETEAVKNTVLPSIAEMKKTVRRLWHETGMKLNSMDFAQLECFIASQVSAYDPFLKEGRGIPSNTVAAMFPWIFARVSDKGGIRLGTHDGVPVFIDFFRRDSERVNSNMVIIGKSGSGKSYGTKSLLTNIASEDAKIFVLDPENEYTELAHSLHGKVINVGNAKYGRLNPFNIITSLEDDEAGEDSVGGSFAVHLQFLEEFFRQILPDVDKEALEYLNSLVERMYLNANITSETDLSKLSPSDYPIFDDLYDIVLEEFQRTNNEYLRNMLQTLMNHVAKFATGGRNAIIWNGPSSITTEENFSVFNFQSLLANRNTTIANAQMLLVLKYIDNEIIKNRDYNKKYRLKRKIVVVIDEAHVFIDTKFPVALDFMFQLAKRIRKYNGMQIVITQNIKDFVGSEEIARKSTAIINACQYSFIFGLAPNDMDDLCRLYEKAGGINEVEQEQIMTAPRGMAFTIMSPTSRSSFMIEVPSTMVEMFEESDYVSHYFIGEEGTRNWEDYIGGSREVHDANATKRALEQLNEKLDELREESNLTFSEISAEEADDYYREKSGGFDYSTADAAASSSGLSFEEEAAPSGGITFEEVAPEYESAPVLKEEVVPPRTEGKKVSVPFDMDTLIATLRAEVRAEVLREVSEQMKIVQTEETPAAATPAKPLIKEEPKKDVAAPEKEVITENVPAPVSEEEHRAETPVEEPKPDKKESPADNIDFAPKFDIMALLEEQLLNYSEMGLVERMEEIDVVTMDISLEELAAYVKESRKRR